MLKMLNILILIALFSAFIFLIKLEDEKNCNCIITWKHHVIKLTIGFVFATLLIIVFSNELEINNDKDMLQIISYFLIIFSISIFYFYIRELNKTNCTCLVEKPMLNQILILLSNILPICLVIIIFMLSKDDKIMKSVKIITEQFLNILVTIFIGIIYLMISINDAKANSRNQKNIYIY